MSTLNPCVLLQNYESLLGSKITREKNIFLVRTRIFLIGTRNFLVITRNFLVTARKFLIPTRNILVRTRKIIFSLVIFDPSRLSYRIKDNDRYWLTVATVNADTGYFIGIQILMKIRL